MTKVVFLTLFYADIFPAGFFFAAVTLFIHYWTDKFRLFVSHQVMCTSSVRGDGSHRS